ncbi:MAG: hypothetical protein MZV70_52230 [Desulfobacterales bacterium]|nr:hypothetical protein [Desulfobacterales bacterium]
MHLAAPGFADDEIIMVDDEQMRIAERWRDDRPLRWNAAMAATPARPRMRAPRLLRAYDYTGLVIEPVGCEPARTDWYALALTQAWARYRRPRRRPSNLGDKAHDADSFLLAALHGARPARPSRTRPTLNSGSPVRKTRFLCRRTHGLSQHIRHRHEHSGFPGQA